MVKRKIALLGATGSIGKSTISVIEEQSALLEPVLVSAHTDYKNLINLSAGYPDAILCLTGISNSSEELRIRALIPKSKIYFGEEELLKLLRDLPYDIALNAIIGSAGLCSSFAILSRGKSLALANKESLVMAGHILSKLAAEKRLPILPVDSEHSAIFQAIGSSPPDSIRKLHITASGGSFRDLPLEEFTKITPEAALKHPNWEMGAKVTLDSATMFNKALEVIEAHWLFGLPYRQIEAVMHPQSIIHSLVEYVDGSILAQLSQPDMRLPILYALSHPKRFESNLVQTSLLELKELSFRDLERERYPLYYLGRQVAEAGGILPTVMNAANEAALKLFLDRKIAFTDIHKVVDQAVQRTANISEPSLDEILEINHLTYHNCLALYRS